MLLLVVVVVGGGGGGGGGACAVLDDDADSGADNNKKKKKEKNENNNNNDDDNDDDGDDDDDDGVDDGDDDCPRVCGLAMTVAVEILMMLVLVFRLAMTSVIITFFTASTFRKIIIISSPRPLPSNRCHSHTHRVIIIGTIITSTFTRPAWEHHWNGCHH